MQADGWSRDANCLLSVVSGVSFGVPSLSTRLSFGQVCRFWEPRALRFCTPAVEDLVLAALSLRHGGASKVLNTVDGFSTSIQAAIAP